MWRWSVEHSATPASLQQPATTCAQTVKYSAKRNAHGSTPSYVDRDSLTPIRSGKKTVTFTGNVADVLSDAEYRALVGRSYTGGDVVVFTPVTTGVDTALVACYDVPHKVVRAIQVGTQQNITMDVRFAVIPAV